MKKILSKTLLVIAWAGIISCICLLLLIGHWMLKPYNILEAEQPFQIVNSNKEVAINSPIILSISYTKYQNREATVSPSIRCKSGNLVTLSSYASRLPLGKNVILKSDNVILPPKVAVGDVCQYSQYMTYRVNPLREVTYTLNSEYFIVKNN